MMPRWEWGRVYLAVLVVAWVMVGEVSAQAQQDTVGLPSTVADTAVADPAAVEAAAQAITVTELARYREVLASDSLRGRATSGAVLEAAARYVAAQFRALGLGPWSSDLTNDGLLNRYTLPTRARLNLAQSRLALAAHLAPEDRVTDTLRNERGQLVQRAVALDFATTARLAADSLAASTLAPAPWLPNVRPASLTVVSGRLTAATLPCDPAAHPLLLYLPPAGLDATTQAAVLAQLTRCAPVLVVAAADTDTAGFAARCATAADTARLVFARYLEAAVGARAWAAYAAPRAVAAVLRTAGLDLAALWADTTPRVRQLPALTLTPSLVFESPPAPGKEPVDQGSGVYATGLLRGSGLPSTTPDAESYLVYTASLDGIAPDGDRPGHADSLTPAPAAATPAAATEVSVAALLALAKAFTQPGLRPRRSVLFVATSGARQHAVSAHRLTYSFDQMETALNLTLAQLGNLRGDTVPIAGLSDFTEARRLAWIAQLHPTLGLTVVDGGPVLQAGTDAAAFARHGVVSLAFAPPRGESPVSAGVRGADEADLARALPAVRLAFYFGQELANAQAWPTWTPAARAAWTTGRGR